MAYEFEYTMEKRVRLSDIDIYAGTQTRAATSDEAVEGYAEAMKGGAEFPPIVVFFDGAKHYLADGFHRFLAAKRIEEKDMLAEVREGSRTDALKHALGANATNGVYRNNADKRYAAEIALEEWPELSNAYLADICKVSVELVRRARKSLGLDNPDLVMGKDGKKYPSRIEREARGRGAAVADELAEGRSGDGGGSGGAPSKKNANYVERAGGPRNELEVEAREMIRKGEMDPRELDTLPSALATDYAAAAIHLLERMPREDAKYRDALDQIERWAQRRKSELAAGG